MNLFYKNDIKESLFSHILIKLYICENSIRLFLFWSFKLCSSEIRYYGVHCVILNPLTVRIFTAFGHLLEGRVLHKEAWVAKLLGTHLSVQVHKKVKFSWRNNSSLAVNGLNFQDFRLYLSLEAISPNIYSIRSFKSSQKGRILTNIHDNLKNKKITWTIT